MGVNKAILVGHVGGDPEVQYVQENVPVAKFTLATNETYKNKDGERVTNTEWHNIVVWRGLAKIVEQYVKKGSKLYIEGKISTRKYEKDGVVKYFTEIIAREMQMLDSKGGEQMQQTAPAHTTENQKNAQIIDDNHDLAAEIGDIDDLPF
jgi:single-strand DNA-binding protein